MKKKIFITVLVLFGVTSVFAQERIAVFPFEDRNNVFIGDEAVMFYREFCNEFTNRNAGSFIVIPRSDIDRLIDTEAAFQLSRFSAQEKTAEMNRVLNGTRILSGLIGKLGNNIRITVSLYTYPELAQLPGGTTISVTNTTELFSKIPELVQNIMNAIAGRSSGSVSPNNPPPVPNNFVLVEGGTYTMGSSEIGETPQHQVTVSSFYMSRYEVTFNDWQEVMSRGNYTKGDNFPVIVSWYDAIEYCNRLSLMEGLTPCYRGSDDNITCDWNANGYRLPTEAEWEYSAKGGNRDYLIFKYSGSNNPAVVAWYIDNSYKQIQLVGTKQPNSLGIYDMSGNVSEWCWDWYGSYQSNAQTNPRGPNSGSERVVRGGMVQNSQRGITSTIRSYWNPSSTWALVGFRVVCNAPATR